jgi:hypothetical protein
MDMSADGTNIVAAEYYGGFIYTSADSGVTWTEQTSSGSRYWSAISSSDDGKRLVATVGDNDDGYVYVSSDSGYTWVEYTSLGLKNWTSATMSGDGQRIAVGADSNNIYLGTVEGASTDTVALSSRPTLNPVTLAPSSMPVNAAISSASISVTSESCYTLDVPSVSRLTTEGISSPSSDVTLLGGIAFNVDCVVNGGSTDVAVTLGSYYDNASLLRAYKTVGSGTSMTLKDITEKVSITNVNVAGTMKTTINYGMMDGGSLDEDGVANGTIVDPIYIGLATTPAGGETLADTGVNLSQFAASGIVMIGLAIGMLYRRAKV